MLKLMMLGIALAAIALSGAMYAADSKTVPLSLEQELDDIQIHEVSCSYTHVPMISPSGSPVCVFDQSVLKLEYRGFEYTGEPFDMFPVKPASASGTQSIGQITRPPTISMSDLPEIGETAIVEITYTNRLGDITAAEFAANPKLSTIGWTVGYGFEVANDYGNTPEKTSYLDGSPAFIFREPVHLAYNESKTYRVEVRAVEEGRGHVAGVGYSSSKGISLYLDDNETLLFQEHKDRYPTQHLRAPTPPEPFPREQVEYEPPSRELLEGFFGAYFAGSERDGYTVSEAMDSVLLLGAHLNYTLPDLKGILGAAGYKDKEIEAEWSNRASTQSFERSDTTDTRAVFLVYGKITNDQITYGEGDRLCSKSWI